MAVNKAFEAFKLQDFLNNFKQDRQAKYQNVSNLN